MKKHSLCTAWTGWAFITTHAPHRLGCKQGAISRAAVRFSGTEIENNSPGRAPILTHALAAAMAHRGAAYGRPVSKYGRAACMTWSLRSQGSTTTRSSKSPKAACGYLEWDPMKNGHIPRRPVASSGTREVLAELARRDPPIGARVSCLFHAWTLLDNFQWAEGYTERYGLIYTDFRNQKAYDKGSSGLWYDRVAASNRLRCVNREVELALIFV